MTEFTITDYIVLVVYIIGVAALGASFGRKQHDTKDYSLGGRSIPWWAIGLSVMATQASAITHLHRRAGLGLPGRAGTDERVPERPAGHGLSLIHI